MVTQSQTDAKCTRRSDAYRRGMRSRSVVRQNEDHDEYDRLYNGMRLEFGAVAASQKFLVKQMADAHWRLERLKAVETALLNAPVIDFAAVERISRRQVSLENSYYRASSELRLASTAKRKPPCRVN